MECKDDGPWMISPRDMTSVQEDAILGFDWSMNRSIRKKVR